MDISTDTEINTEIDTEADIFPYEDTDDNADRKTHIVNSGMNKHIDPSGTMHGPDIVDVARLNGQEVVALCGARFVPSHNPEKYPVCHDCIHIAEHLMHVHNE